MVRSERGVGDAREKKSPSRSRHGATPQQLKLSRSSVFRLRIFFLASLPLSLSQIPPSIHKLDQNPKSNPTISSQFPKYLDLFTFFRF